jgi:allophanate hydrolase
VPAALNGIVGVKPTKGLIPTTGVVPACRTLDCVTVFARDLGLARSTVELLSGPDGIDVRARDDRPVALTAAPLRIAVPTSDNLGGLADGWQEAFGAVVDRLRGVGAEVHEIDIAPLLRAAELLYGGAFVAERTAAVGDHITKHADLIGTDLDPTVAAIVQRGADATAADYFRDLEQLDELGAEGEALLDGFSALLTPTTTWHPTLTEVAEDPVGANSRMGRYTNFANLLDMSSVAVPAGSVGGLPFGVMLTGRAFADRLLADIATLVPGPTVDLLVVGAHLNGQPLNHQLVSAGGSLLAEVRTAATYRLHALDTQPPKPGLVRVTGGGVSVPGEVWRLPAAGFGRFVDALPAPMTIGTVELDDGTGVTGFLCEPYALEGARDISDLGGWRAYVSGVAGSRA